MPNFFAKIKEIYEYRNMIHKLVRRELRGQYQKSVLGMLWTLITPMLNIIVYSIVFTVVFPSNIPHYPVYLVAGMIPWTFFSEAVGEGTKAIVNNADMTKKIYFPREALVISTVTSKLVNMLIAFVIIIVLVLVTGVGIDPLCFLVLPLVITIEYILSLGFALFFSSIAVFFQDMIHIVGVILQIWMWATPVMYSLDLIPQKVVPILKINPMTNVVNCYHLLIYNKWIPSAALLFGTLLFAVVILIIGEAVFMHLEGNFAEEL